jgi:FMN-dependent NADH-azoreductase
MRLLHIIASPRGARSRTLNISGVFLKTLKAKYPGSIVEDLDLFNVKLPAIFEDTVEAKYALMSGGTLNEQSKTSWDQVSKFSKEFLTFDAYLISSPMWNFSVPYVLKHYIDVIMQVGILFNITQHGVEGLAINKKMFCITSRGNDYGVGSQMHQFDFQEPYLRAIFGMAGIHDISFINAQPMDYDPGVTQNVLDAAKAAAVLMAQNSDL